MRVSSSEAASEGHVSNRAVDEAFIIPYVSRVLCSAHADRLAVAKRCTTTSLILMFYAELYRGCTPYVS